MSPMLNCYQDYKSLLLQTNEDLEQSLMRNIYLFEKIIVVVTDPIEENLYVAHG